MNWPVRGDSTNSSGRPSDGNSHICSDVLLCGKAMRNLVGMRFTAALESVNRRKKMQKQGNHCSMIFTSQDGEIECAPKRAVVIGCLWSDPIVQRAPHMSWPAQAVPTKFSGRTSDGNLHILQKGL